MLDEQYDKNPSSMIALVQMILGGTSIEKRTHPQASPEVDVKILDGAALVRTLELKDAATVAKTFRIMKTMASCHISSSNFGALGK